GVDDVQPVAVAVARHATAGGPVRAGLRRIDVQAVPFNSFKRMAIGFTVLSLLKPAPASSHTHMHRRGPAADRSDRGRGGVTRPAHLSRQARRYRIRLANPTALSCPVCQQWRPPACYGSPGLAPGR